MKHLLLILLLFAGFFSYSQSVVPLRGDTIKIYKVGGSAELVLQNKTKDSTGVLVNLGNGVTSFLKSKKINDSTIVIGLDTLSVGSGSGGGGGADSAIIVLNGVKKTLIGSTIVLQVDSNAYVTLASRKKLSDSLVALINGKISTTLAPGNIIIGNGSSVATAFSVTGDFSFSSSGVGTIVGHAVTLAKQATGTANALQGWDNSGNAAGVIIDAPLQLIGGHLKDTSTGGGGGSGMIPLTNAHIYVGNVSNVAVDVALSGDATMSNTGVIAIGTNKVTNTQLAQMPANTTKGNNTGSTANAADLTAPQEVANLGASALGQRVMTDPITGALATQGEILHSPVRLATAAALPANTYNNGASGVGATITANSNGALTIDGVAVSANNRVLIKDEAAPSHNALYTVTQAGSGSLPYILTRGSYSSIPGNMVAGSHVYVQEGSTNAKMTFFQTTTGAITFGTTALVYGIMPLPFVNKGDLLVGTGSGNYINFPAGPDGSVLTPDASQVTGLRYSIQPTIFNVFDVAFAGGAFGDGQVVTDMAIVSGTAGLFSTQAIFTSGDVGKIFYAKGIGAGGNDTTGTITAFTNSHQVTISVNASTGGGGHVFRWGHDDAPAIQAGLNALYARGGGTLYVPYLAKGRFYVIGNALNHSDNLGHDPNCQIYIPSQNFLPFTNPDSTSYVIKILGETPPPFAQQGALSNDSTAITSGGTLMCSFLISNYGQGAVIGSAYTVFTGFGNFSATRPVLENVYISVPDGLQGAYRSGIDMLNPVGMYLKNNLVMTDVPCTQKHKSLYPVFGMRFTGINGSQIVYLDGINECIGFNYGAVTSEHTTGQILACECNTTGLLVTATNHAFNLATYKSHWNSDDIAFHKYDTVSITDGGSIFEIGLLDIEGIHTGTRYYDHNHGFNDSLGKARGTVGYFFGVAGISVPTLPTFNPTSTNTKLSFLGDQLNGNFLTMGGVSNSQMGSHPALGAAGNAVLVLDAGATAAGNTNWAQLVLSNNQGSNNSLIADIPFYNRNGAGIVAEITGYRGGASNSGKIVFSAANAGVFGTHLTMDGLTNAFGLPVVFPAATAAIPSMNLPLSSGVPPSTQGNFYATSNHLWYYDNSTWKDILAGGGGGGGTAAGSAYDVQFTNANGGFSTLPSSLFHVDSTNGRLGFGTASPSFTLHVKGSAATTTGIRIENTSAASNAAAFIEVKNNSTSVLQFGTLSTTFTPSGVYTANASYLFQNSASLNFITNSQAINFSANNGASANMGLNTSGRFFINNMLAGSSTVPYIVVKDVDSLTKHLKIGTGLAISGDSLTATGVGISVANPTGLIGMTAVNGSSATATRSDGHSAIDPAIAPTWTAAHIFNAGFSTTQLRGQGTSPSISAGSGAGSGPTSITLTGKDIGGLIAFNTGTSPSTNSTIMTVTYTNAFPTGSFVTLVRAADQSLLAGEPGVYVSATASGFTINSSATGLAASVHFQWYFTATGY